MERAPRSRAPHCKVGISSNPAKHVANTKSIALARSSCLTKIEQPVFSLNEGPKLFTKDHITGHLGTIRYFPGKCCGY